MALAHFIMLIHELLSKDPDIVTEEAPLIVLDSKSDMCMAKNGKDTKHTRHISRRVHFVRNGKKCKMHKIDWCEGGLQLADIDTKNVSEPYLTPKMKYIVVRLENWYRTIVQEGWHNTSIVYGTRVMNYYTILSLVLDSISLNVRRTCKLSIQNENNVFLNGNSVEGKPYINRESKSDWAHNLVIQLLWY